MDKIYCFLSILRL